MKKKKKKEGIEVLKMEFRDIRGYLAILVESVSIFRIWTRYGSDISKEYSNVSAS